MLIMNFVLLLAVTKLIRFIIFMFSVLLTSQYALRDKKINNNSCSDLLIIGLRMFFFPSSDIDVQTYLAWHGRDLRRNSHLNFLRFFIRDKLMECDGDPVSGPGTLISADLTSDPITFLCTPPVLL